MFIELGRGTVTRAAGQIVSLTTCFYSILSQRMQEIV